MLYVLCVINLCYETCCTEANRYTQTDKPDIVSSHTTHGVDMSKVLKALAAEMVANHWDYSPVADKLLPAGQSMVCYGKQGIWVVDASETCNLDAMPKLYRVDVDMPDVDSDSAKPVTRSAKPVTRKASRLIIALIAVTLASPAFAWKHSGGPTSWGTHTRSK